MSQDGDADPETHPNSCDSINDKMVFLGVKNQTEKHLTSPKYLFSPLEQLSGRIYMPSDNITSTLTDNSEKNNVPSTLCQFRHTWKPMQINLPVPQSTGPDFPQAPTRV